MPAHVTTDLCDSPEDVFYDAQEDDRHEDLRAEDELHMPKCMAGTSLRGLSSTFNSNDDRSNVGDWLHRGDVYTNTHPMVGEVYLFALDTQNPEASPDALSLNWRLYARYRVVDVIVDDTEVRNFFC